MGPYIFALIVGIALYICYGIHQERKRRGKPGIPVLGQLFDSISVNVHEEVLDEVCDSSTNESASRSEKKKKHRKHKHKHHHCSKKEKKQRRKSSSKGKDLKPVKASIVELVEETTQRSDKSDRIVRTAKTSKNNSRFRDSMDVSKDSTLVAASIDTQKADKRENSYE